MKSFFATLAIAVCGMPFAAHATQIVNIDATSAAGTTITLNAGTYQATVIGTSQGGAYNGWDYATLNFNTSFATPAPGAWVDSFAITANAKYTSYVAGGNPASTTALGALATYQSSVLYANSTTPANSSMALNSAIFTISSTQCVNFTVADYLFVDNWGGESLQLTPVSASSATPEPATFGLIGMMLAGGAVAFRRKLAR